MNPPEPSPMTTTAVASSQYGVSTSMTTSSRSSPVSDTEDASAATVRARIRRASRPAAGEDTIEATASGNTLGPGLARRVALHALEVQAHQQHHREP